MRWRGLFLFLLKHSKGHYICLFMNIQLRHLAAIIWVQEHLVNKYALILLYLDIGLYDHTLLQS